MDDQKNITVENDFTPEVSSANMFRLPLGEKYAKKFSEVFNATIEEQDKVMGELYESSKEDESLTEKQKKIIAGCTLAYNMAQAEKGVSTPIISFVKSKKPNLTKAVSGKNYIRYRRTIEDLYQFNERTGFWIHVAELPKLIKYCEATFGFMKKEDVNKSFQEINEDLEYEVMYVAAISRFSRTIALTDYIAQWYVVMLMKQIKLLSFVHSDIIKSNAAITDQAKNMIKGMSYIHHLEMERFKDSHPKAEEDKTKEAELIKQEEAEYEDMLDKESDTVLDQTGTFDEKTLEPELSIRDEQKIPDNAEIVEV
jgi:hypothetical protein